jgi:sporulation protein YlmC with PRC-barrel domain
VKAVYDVYDGKGLVEKTLVKEEFSTLKGLLIRNVEVGQEDVSFDFNKVEVSATIIKVTKQDLFKISKKEEFRKYSKNY